MKAFALIACVSLSAIATAAHAQSVPSASSASPAAPAPNDAAGPVSPSASGTQVQQTTQPTGLDEIVVTARRVSENIQSVPLAVSALSGATLQKQGIRNVRDLSSIAPNLNVGTGNSGAGTTVITIRGQNQSNTLLSIDSAVGLYIDGVNVPRTYGTTAALVDVARVEVLRGPQGTLYGRNTTGGALSVVSNEPKKEFGASLQATGGNYGTWGLLGIVNVPVSDNFGVRFVASHTEHNGYGKDITTGQDVNLERSTYYRGIAKYDDGRFSATLKGDYSRINNGGIATRITGLTGTGGNMTAEIARELGITSAAASSVLASYVGKGSFYDTYSNAHLLSKVRVGSAGLSLEYKLTDDLRLKSITGWRGFNSVYQNDADGTPYIGNQSYQPTRDNFYSEEVQVLGGNELFNYVFGGFWSYEKGFAQETSLTLGALQGGRTTTSSGDVYSKSVAGFGQANAKLLDNLTLTIGGRLTKETHKVVLNNYATTAAGSTCTIATAFLDDGVTCKHTGDHSYSKPTWIASLNYKVTKDILTYAKISRGFRGGGENFRASGTIAATYAPFAPETVTEYELGLKSELFDRRLRINVALFNDDYKNIQRSINALLIVSPPTTGTVVTNAAKAQLRGIEVESEGRINDMFSLGGSMGYLDPKYKNFTDFTGDRTNEPWPAPHWNYTINGRMTTPTSLGRFDANLTWQWQSRSYASGGTNAVNKDQTAIDAYGLLNARVSLTIDKYDADIALFGRNLLAKHYYTNGINFEALGYNVMFPGDPRTFGIQLTKRFGAGI